MQQVKDLVLLQLLCRFQCGMSSVPGGLGACTCQGCSQEKKKNCLRCKLKRVHYINWDLGQLPYLLSPDFLICRVDTTVPVTFR